MTQRTQVLEALANANGPLLAPALLARLDTLRGIEKMLMELIAEEQIIAEFLPGDRVTYRLAPQLQKPMTKPYRRDIA
jgi:hypothetical protein